MVIDVSKETKSERINLHLTPTDKSIIKEKADLVGMNMTNYLTACAIVEKIYCVGDKKSFDEIIHQLKKSETTLIKFVCLLISAIYSLQILMNVHQHCLRSTNQFKR
jgi:hypothetical protein